MIRVLYFRERRLEACSYSVALKYYIIKLRMANSIRLATTSKSRHFWYEFTSKQQLHCIERIVSTLMHMHFMLRTYVC